MNLKTSAELRQAFLDYFGELNHAVVPSSPLPNRDNPTLLFTNAGMNQFADVFLGKETRPYRRAVTAQKCMRVSGKHNDLENVGPSQRHHTFFEMLGNFSFGDYFKREAIDYAWQFLTAVVGLAPERLWATVYLDDDEAADLWQRYLPAERVLRFGKKDNYWEMGDVGPCGPCSEIHYYRGDLAQSDARLLNNDNDAAESFLEVWNLVFMQFERDAQGNTTPLPKPSIDTGMGLERLVRILQAAPSNYDTDLFLPAIDRVQQLLSHSDAQRSADYVGYRVIADHGRAATFLIGDGVIPGNTAAPYVLRMIIRRAARFGRKIGFTAPFLAEIAQVYIDQMGDAYPDLRRHADFIRQTLTQEEERFARTLDNALTRFDAIVSQLRRDGETVIPGALAFDLHATSGLALEITRDLAQEHGLTVDEAGFQAARQAHAEASGRGAFGQYETGESVYAAAYAQLAAQGVLDRTGVDYDPYSGATGRAPVVALFAQGQAVESAVAGTDIELAAAATPFYVEAGGEVSDTGVLRTPTGQVEVAQMRSRGGLVLHVGRVTRGVVSVGQTAELEVDEVRRLAIRRNHTATHILHRELRAALGNHVTQQGSLVAPDRLRFDFSHNEAVAADQLAAIERAVNDAILADYRVEAHYMPKETAVRAGAMALFGEKYGDIVRTVQIDDGGRYSFELCGGLHVAQTGQIGAFYFLSEGSVAAGVRRVEAVTGQGAQQHVAQQIGLLGRAARRLNSPTAELPERVEALLAENRRLQKTVEQLRRAQARAQFEQLYAARQTVHGATLLVGRVEDVDADGLREMIDWFTNRVGSGAAVLAVVEGDRPTFVAGVTADLVARGLKAGDLVRTLGQITGGGGGGRPQLAQAGGRDATKLPDALAAVPDLVERALQHRA